MLVDLKREDLLRLIQGTIPDLCYRDSGLFVEKYYDFRELGGGWIMIEVRKLNDISLIELYKAIKKSDINI